MRQVPAFLSWGSVTGANPRYLVMPGLLEDTRAIMRWSPSCPRHLRD
jgi:hypothetical protein